MRTTLSEPVWRRRSLEVGRHFQAQADRAIRGAPVAASPSTAASYLFQLRSPTHAINNDELLIHFEVANKAPKILILALRPSH